MKRFTLTLALMSQLSFSASAQQEALAAEIYDVYQFCLEEAQRDSEMTERDILNCINEDLEYNDFKRFTNLKAVKKAIKDYLPEATPQQGS